jgi:cold shock CspA family protein
MKSREFGTVATYNGSYAFIRSDAEDTQDVFAHASELPDAINRGDRYDVAPDIYKPGKMRAVGVQFIDLRGSSVR